MPQFDSDWTPSDESKQNNFFFCGSQELENRKIILYNIIYMIYNIPN